MPSKYKGEERRRPAENRESWGTGEAAEKKRKSFQKTADALRPIVAYLTTTPQKKKKKEYSWEDLPMIGDEMEEEQDEVQ